MPMQKPRPPYTLDPTRCRASLAHIGRNGRGCPRRPVSAADRHPIATVPSIHRPGDVWLPGPDRFGFVCPRCHHATPWLVTQTSHLGGGRPALAGPCCDTVPRSITRTVRRAS